MKYNFNFINYFKKFNFVSLIFVLLSLFFVLFKGLNYGIDFKGGTLIEVRIQNNDIRVSDIRDFYKSNLDFLRQFKWKFITDTY